MVIVEVGLLQEMLTLSPQQFQPLPWYSKAFYAFKHCTGAVVKGLGMGKHQVKVLDTAENIGYVEFQVRSLLGVPAHAKSRLWYQPKHHRSLLAPLFDRQDTLYAAIEYITGMEDKGPYCRLMLELKDGHGLWPSGFPEAHSDIDLEQYHVLTEGYKLTDFNSTLPLGSVINESVQDLGDGASKVTDLATEKLSINSVTKFVDNWRDSHVVDLSASDAAVRDAVVPDAVVPEAVVPDAVVPEAVVPWTVVPEAVVTHRVEV